MRAAACNYWDQGVHGIYLNQWFQGANWPYRSAFYEQLREIPHPDIMAPKDKLYLIPTAGSYQSPPWEPGMPLPRKLAQGEPLRLELPVSDDLPFWNRAGRLHEVLLRFRVMNTNQLDRLVFRLNGQDAARFGPAQDQPTLSHEHAQPGLGIRLLVRLSPGPLLLAAEG